MIKLCVGFNAPDFQTIISFIKCQRLVLSFHFSLKIIINKETESWKYLLNQNQFDTLLGC